MEGLDCLFKVFNFEYKPHCVNFYKFMQSVVHKLLSGNVPATVGQLYVLIKGKR